MGCVSSTEHATLQQKCVELEASLKASATAAADNATQLKTANASLTEVRGKLILAANDNCHINFVPATLRGIHVFLALNASFLSASV